MSPLHTVILQKEGIEAGSVVDCDIRFGRGHAGEDHVLIPIGLIQGVFGFHDNFSGKQPDLTASAYADAAVAFHLDALCFGKIQEIAKAWFPIEVLPRFFEFDFEGHGDSSLKITVEQRMRES
jgi:hypothetical protein